MSIAAASITELESLYNAREGSDHLADPEASAAVAQRAMSLGEPLLAYDVCRFALGLHPQHLRLKQLEALALARSGAAEQARHLLERQYHEGSRDEETLGILARIYKDRALEASNADDSRDYLRRSLELYREAYRIAGGYWSGVNAATVALAIGDTKTAVTFANEVRAHCLSEITRSPQDVWMLATLGEAALIIGNVEEARSWYERAREAGAAFGDCASMRRNARLVLNASGKDPAILDKLVPTPVIAIFAGHMLDTDDRSSPRFPEAMSGRAADAIRAHLERTNVQIGYAAAASGADILFHECMLELGRETHVVLPEPPETFAQSSVRNGQSDWVDRYHRVLDRAATVSVHSTSGSGDIGYTYANWMALGLARLRARQVEGDIRAFALWDGKAGLPGGTASAVRDWQTFGQAVEWLAPSDPPNSNWHLAPPDRHVRVPRVLGTQRIVSLLFADAVGFSKLSDQSIPGFVKHFLGAVATVLDRQPEPALTRNTWGDGLYFTFATPRAAGLYALELCDAVRSTDWTAFGLPANLSLRVALHCGPAHEVTDPVTGQRNFTGTHVSRAARIEPVTPAGCVYASQSFAALCECEGVDDFVCEYVGRMPLAKSFGHWPTYSMRRR